MTEAVQREAVCQAGLTWQDTPWHHKACVRGVRGGVDCAQLLIAAYADAGVIGSFDPGPYCIDQMLHSPDESFLAWLQRFGRPVDVPGRGDVVVWRFGRSYSHGGIVLDWPGQVLHAFRPYGRVCVTPADASRLAGRDRVFYTFW